MLPKRFIEIIYNKRHKHHF